MPSKLSEKWNKNGTLQAGAMLLFGGVLLYFQKDFLQNRSFWVDEIWTVRLCQLDWADMIGETAQDVHPPLYYIIQKLAVLMAGSSEAVYRYTALIPLVLLIFVAAFSMRKRLGFFATALFLLFASLAPRAMNANAEARMYSFAFLFVTLCGYGMYLILSGSNGWPLLTAMGVCAAYTHYYAFAQIAVIYGMLLIAFLIQRRSLKPWLICFAVSVLLYLPWALPLLTTFGRTTGDWWLTQVPTLLETLLWLTSEHIMGYAMLALMVASALLYAGMEWKDHAGITAENYLVLTAWTVAAVSLVLGYGASALIRPLFLCRYFYPCCGLIWLCFGVTVQSLCRRIKGRKWLRYAGMGLVFAASLYMMVKPYRDRTTELREVNDQTTGSIDYVEELAQCDHPVMASNVGMNLQSEAVSLYFPDGDVREYTADGSWLDPERDAFLFTPEQEPLEETLVAAMQEKGMVEEDSNRCVRLAAGYFTVHHLIPQA